MNYTKIKKLPPRECLLQEFPLSDTAKQQIAQDRQEIKNILSGQDHRLLMIVGPCSAWPQTAVLEYARRLVSIQTKVKQQLKLVMRVYIQKPRTTKGWAGLVNQPDPCLPPDISAGIRYAREMMVNVIEMGLPIADEALFIHQACGFLELLSWVAIGARSTENPEHRIFASAMDCAVGLKNPTHGVLAIGVNSVVAAQQSHAAVLEGYEVQTHGNPYAHLVLRGGNHTANYSIADLTAVQTHMQAQHIQNPAIVIDASHDNCLVNGVKDYRAQPQIIWNIVDSLTTRPDLQTLVKGFMLESFLKAGQQKMDTAHPECIDKDGLSITDPCLGWEETEKFLLQFAAARKALCQRP